MKTTLTAAVFALALAVPPAAAPCEMSTTLPDATASGAGQTYYVDWDCTVGPVPGGTVCNTLFAGSVWIYKEENGSPGLQRGDANKDDTCGGLFEGDERIY